MCLRHSCSACWIVLFFCTWLRNWSWNICAMINWNTLIKYNILSFTSASVCKIFPTRIRKIHQVILSFNNSLSQQVRYWCIIHINIILQSQSLIVPNVSQYMYQSFKVYFTRILWKLFYLVHCKNQVHSCRQ